MSTRTHVVAIDQGTTSSRAIVFDAQCRPVATAQRDLTQHYPAPGLVEHDAQAIWRDVEACVRAALAQAGLGAHEIAAIGITNQRETAVVWDRATGAVVHNAIVWQDRRTEPVCRALREAGHEDAVRARTGLRIDPYFSATKLAWLLDQVPGVRARAQAGALAFGTIDSWLLWQLTGGAVHATDATNASRTLLFDIHTGDWSDAMCALFRVPRSLLPQVCDSAGRFGETSLFGAAIPIAGIAGDQQAALVGQGCFATGDAKATYGTGCFLLVNTGARALVSDHRLLTTIAYRLKGCDHYALEGAIFVAGAAVRWLRDGLGLIARADETDGLASEVADNGGVYLVPAFAGLGAPHWQADARALLTGMTLGTTAAHVARATLEAVAYQTHDLVTAMRADGAMVAGLRVDGGMAANAWLCRFLAGVLDTAVARPAMLETTARGAALLAGHGVGLWPDMAAVPALAEDAERFAPAMDGAERDGLLAGWRAALRQALGT